MGDNSNFLNYKRKIFTATPLSTKPNTFILFHLIDKRACNYLKCDPSYLCGRVAQRNIDVLSAEKGERCRTTCRTNGLDGLPREYVHTRMNVHGGGGRRGKGGHNGKHSLHITVNGQSSIQKAKLMKNKKTKKNGLIT
jgi:hypothetical protein